MSPLRSTFRFNAMKTLKTQDQRRVCTMPHLFAFCSLISNINSKLSTVLNSECVILSTPLTDILRKSKQNQLKCSVLKTGVKESRSVKQRFFDAHLNFRSFLTGNNFKRFIFGFWVFFQLVIPFCGPECMSRSTASGHSSTPHDSLQSQLLFNEDKFFKQAQTTTQPNKHAEGEEFVLR